MIKVISTVFVYRPERVLYYLPEGKVETARYLADGACPPQLQKYQDAFGTYDQVGIFFFSPELHRQTGMNRVVGIEYRKDDASLDLPEHLPHVILPACDIIIQDIACEHQLSNDLLDEIITYARNKANARSDEFRYTENGIVAAFCAKEKLRILYEIEKLNDSGSILSNNLNDLSKEELFCRAFREPITEYNNWSWMWEFLKTYHLNGIKGYGFVHFDVKDFKMINELYNHHIGNTHLKRIAQNIQTHSDWIYCGARCHNDNFAMMIRDMPEEETRNKLAAFFDELSVLDNDPSYHIFYRCGVVRMRNAMNTGDIVADCAKLAQATGTAHNTTEINFYTDEMHEHIFRGKLLKAYLDTAIRANEFQVYLQPKFDIITEHICGAEALVRWNYKNKELLPPYLFIPYFEQDNSIIKVDDVVLRAVCVKLNEWKNNGYPLYPISVNLSRKHLGQPCLADYLAEIVDSYNVEHSFIEFELTESLAYDDHEYLLSVMNDLKNKVFRISMDDFGTGYSSFSLLNKMPLDTLKIDKSFVDLITDKNNSDRIKIILRCIISMTRELGVHCIAEGAENYEQILALRDLGCKSVQGYYYSKPIPMDSFDEKYLGADKGYD